MLVLCRRVNQNIFLDVPGHGRIILTVVDVRSDRCRIGITAAPDVLILREELESRGPWRGGPRGPAR